MFLFSAFKSPAKVNKKMLEDVGIPVADSYLDFNIDEELLISKCKTGNFYFGSYDNKKVIIKKVDITKDDLILNEFIFWNEQMAQLFYPNLIGVLLKYSYAYIIFKNDFVTTLKNRLNQSHKKELTIKNKIKIVRQLLVLINFFKNNNIIHNGLRSSVIGLDSDNIIKIIDYGDLVELNCQDEDIQEVEEEMDRYTPPENLNNAKIKENFDIYSFGQILIDLFSSKESKENNNNKINIINKEEDNNNNKIISNKINPLLSNIIYRCIEPDKNKRITLDELNTNIQLVLNCYYNENSNQNIDSKNKIIDNINENFLNENKNINDYYQYGKSLMNKLNKIFDDMDNNLQNKIIYLKNDITSQYKKAFNTFYEMEKSIKENIKKLFDSSRNIIDNFYTKLIESTISMQMNSFSNAFNDLYDIIKLGNGMIIDISLLSTFKNHEQYKKPIENYLEKTKNEIDQILKKNSSDSEFDLIYKIYENKYNNYQKYCDYINDCISPLKQIQNDLERFNETNNNKMCEVLAINLDVENLDTNSDYFKSMNENIYAKIKENSNIIYIFNYYSKFISQHQINDDIIFNSKCYSFYDKEENCIYVSGGIPNSDINYNYYDDSLIKISIKFVSKESSDKNQGKNNIIINNKNKNFYNIFNFGEYYFEITKLNKLLNGRCSHSMIRSSKDRNMLINIGGKNTKTTEVYNLECNKSAYINDLPSICINPTCIEYNGCIYLFGTIEFGSNCIYFLDMNKYDNFIWTSIQFNINAGSLKRGMNIIDISDSLYLFGGYDQNKEYSDIYKVSFNEEYLDINYCGNLLLSHDCSFNSNAIIENSNNKNIENKDENHMIIILMDTINIVDEIDLVTGKNNFYELN